MKIHDANASWEIDKGFLGHANSPDLIFNMSLFSI